MSQVKERLLTFLRTKRISQREFTERLGVSAAYIGAMRKSIPDEKVRRIRAEFPELNTDWLLYGDGEMLLAGEEAAVGELIPLLPVEAFAGRLQDYSSSVGLRDCRKIVSPIPGADFAIQVTGDSMEPKIHDGSTILIKRINDRAFIPWGHSMVIDSENGVLVKQLYPSEHDRGCVEARSLNPKYPPITIPRRSIFGLYRILGTVQIYTTL